MAKFGKFEGLNVGQRLYIDNVYEPFILPTYDHIIINIIQLDSQKCPHV